MSYYPTAGSDPKLIPDQPEETMIKARPEDRELIIRLLTRSFEDNLSVNYIIRRDHKKQSRIRTLMEYSLDQCAMFGEVLLSDDRMGCALILYPHHKRTDLKTIFMDIKLIAGAVGITGLRKTLEREKQIKKMRPDERMAYLWFIGVDPDQQHRGIGGKFLQQILDHGQKQELPVFLETSTLKNIPWYERSGFRVYAKLELGYDLFFLKWIPSK